MKLPKIKGLDRYSLGIPAAFLLLFVLSAIGILPLIFSNQCTLLLFIVPVFILLLTRSKDLFYLYPPLVVVIASALVYWLYPTLTISQQKALILEIIKYLIQLGLIVIIGGLLVHGYNRRRDRDKAINDLRKTLLSNLIRAYFVTKKARRILSANVRPTGLAADTIPYAIYVEQIKAINDAQLEFEFYKYQLRTFSHAFTATNATKLKRMASRMERYLNKFVKEYQELRVSPDSKEISMSRLPELEAVINRETFKSKFSGYFHESVKLIQNEILNI